MTRKAARLHQNGPSVGTKKTLKVRHHQAQKVHHIHVPRSARTTHEKRRVLQNIFHKKIRIPPCYAKAKPGHDFYRHVNEIWQRKTPMPVYASSYGLSEEIESYIEGFLMDEIEHCRVIAEKGAVQTTLEGQLRDTIGRLALSSLRPVKQKNSVDYLKRVVRSMGCMRDAHDLSTVLGQMCRFNVPTVLELSIVPKEKGSYELNIAPGSMGLKDVSYYAALAHGKSDVLFAYTKLVQTVTKKLDVDDVSHVIPFEAELSAVLGAVAKKDNDSIDTGLEELKRRYKHIDWDSLLSGYGISGEAAKELRTAIHIDSTGWLEKLDKEIGSSELARE
jgi:predicted metalloendopeptidase